MTATNHPDPTPLLRWMSDMLCLWSLCANAACRRGRACARDPRQCLARCAPLTPEEAREGVAVMLDGLGQGLGYDVLREEAPDEIAAVEDWIARVEAARAMSEAAPCSRAPCGEGPAPPTRAAARPRARAGGAPSGRRPPAS